MLPEECKPKDQAERAALAPGATLNPGRIPGHRPDFSSICCRHEMLCTKFSLLLHDQGPSRSDWS